MGTPPRRRRTLLREAFNSRSGPWAWSPGLAYQPGLYASNRMGLDARFSCHAGKYVLSPSRRQVGEKKLFSLTAVRAGTVTF